MTRYTYWIKFPRNFSNEFCVGVATSPDSAEQYKAEGFSRINRAALRELCAQGDAATQVYVDASQDGHSVYDRFNLARSLRS